MAVTRADVARRAGVSPAVVSYVLNPGTRPVSADARKRIEDAIRELGYRPNAIAQALRRSSTMTIGLMVPDLGNPVVSSLAREIEDIAYDLGYVLFVGTVGNDAAREERYIRKYVDRKVDALIVIGTHHSPALKEVSDGGLPVLVLDSIEPGQGLSSVVSESRNGSAAAVRHLIDHGHTRIAFIGAPAGIPGSAYERARGWRDAVEEAGLPSDERLVYHAPAVSRSGGHTAAESMLDRAEATAVFVASDVQAVGVVGAIRERGLMVPADFGVVSFDNSELAERAFPGLTSVDVEIETVARLAMERLLARLDKSETSETHDVVPTKLVVRRSCGCDGATPPVAGP